MHLGNVCVCFMVESSPTHVLTSICSSPDYRPLGCVSFLILGVVSKFPTKFTSYRTDRESPR